MVNTMARNKKTESAALNPDFVVGDDNIMRPDTAGPDVNTGESDELTQIAVKVQDLKLRGKTKKECEGWLAFEHSNLKAADAKAILSAVFGEGRSTATDHAKAIRILIAGKAAGKKNKEIVEDLGIHMGWKENTSATLLSYYAFMVEYARQVNGQ